MIRHRRLLAILAVISLHSNAEEHPPPRVLVRIGPLRALAAHKAHRLAVPVAQEVDGDAARKAQHDAVRPKVEIVVAEVGRDQILHAKPTAARQYRWRHDATRKIRTLGPNTTSRRRSALLKCARRCLRWRGGSSRLPLVADRMRTCDMFSAMGSCGAGNGGGAHAASSRVWWMCGIVDTSGENAHGRVLEAKSSCSVGSTYLWIGLACNRELGGKLVPHEPQGCTETPRQLQRAVEDVAKDNVIGGVGLQEAT